MLEPNTSSEQEYTLPQDCDFMEIGYNDSVEYDCSPKLPFMTQFKGLLINGPKDVTWPRGASVDDYDMDIFGDGDSPLRLPIAGLSWVPDPTGNGDVAYNVRVVAVNQHTAESYCGTMQFVGTLFSAPDNDFDKEKAERVFFNIDLIHNLGIPVAEATYTVYATLGEYKSNVLTVKACVK